MKKELRICSQCYEEKELNLINFEFNKERQVFRKQCKICQGKIRKNRTKSPQILREEENKLLLPKNKKRCSICNNILDIEKFKKGHSSRCIECSLKITDKRNIPIINLNTKKYLIKTLISKDLSLTSIIIKDQNQNLFGDVICLITGIKVQNYNLTSFLNKNSIPGNLSTPRLFIKIYNYNLGLICLNLEKNYQTCKSTLTFKCKQTETIFNSTFDCLLYKKSFPYEVTIRRKLLNEDIILNEEYRGADCNHRLKNIITGDEWNQRYDNYLLYGKVNLDYSIVFFEDYFKNYLHKTGFQENDYIKEYSFNKKLIVKGSVRNFDFYIPKLNLIIEIDEDHHKNPYLKRIDVLKMEKALKLNSNLNIKRIEVSHKNKEDGIKKIEDFVNNYIAK